MKTTFHTFTKALSVLSNFGFSAKDVREMIINGEIVITKELKYIGGQLHITDRSGADVTDLYITVRG